MKTARAVCGHVFGVKGRGLVRCELKAGHVAHYHQFDFGTWIARYWPPRRRYFTKIGTRSHLPKECI